MPLGQATINKIINVQDSGRLINPKLVEQQVPGGMSQSIGFALYEEILVDPGTLACLILRFGLARFYNSGYALILRLSFVETDDPTGPYGNKAVGETTTILSGCRHSRCYFGCNWS